MFFSTERKGSMEINIKKLDELSAKEVLDFLYERVKVFVVEQNCPYQEVDKDDYIATHVVITENDKILGYTRIINRDEYVTFGRVLITEEARGRKLGKYLVEITLEEIKRNYPDKNIKISAQHYLLAFYESFGFVPTTDIYLEDDIPHIGMTLNK